MLSPTLAGQLLRPEWLFEAVHAVQALAASATDSSAPTTLDRFFDLYPPESDLEQEITQYLLARIKTEQAMWCARHFDHPGTPSEDASCELAPPSARLKDVVARAQLLFHSDFATHWTVEAVARRVGCNRTDLERSFRRHCTCTVHGYLIICRVDAAKRLLRNTAWRVGEVAKAAGFRSKVSLYEHFRKVPPRQQCSRSPGDKAALVGAVSERSAPPAERLTRVRPLQLSSSRSSHNSTHRIRFIGYCARLPSKRDQSPVI